MYHDCTLQPKSRARTNLSTWGAWRRATSTVACFSNKSDKSPQSSNKNLTLCISRTYMSHGWQVSAPLALHRTLSSILYDVVGAEITESKMDFIDFPHWKFGFMNSIQDWSWTELTTRSNQPLLNVPLITLSISILSSSLHLSVVCMNINSNWTCSQLFIHFYFPEISYKE